MWFTLTINDIVYTKKLGIQQFLLNSQFAKLLYKFERSEIDNDIMIRG